MSTSQARDLMSKMPDSGTVARKILDHYRKIGQHGATVDEVAASLCIPHQSANPTISRLKLDGFLSPKGSATRSSMCNRQVPVLVISISFQTVLNGAGI